MDYKTRLAKLLDRIDNAGADSFLVTKGVNIAYLSGFAGSDSLIYITDKKRYFITDSRYYEEALNTVSGFEIVLSKASAYSEIKELVAKTKPKKIGFESMDIPYEVASRLKKIVLGSRLVPLRNLIENIRSIKERAEIDLIRKSIAVTKKVMKIAVSSMKPRMTEEEVARRIEIEFILRKAKPAFSSIVAIDENASKPHAALSGRRLKKDSTVMVDIGCNLGGYNSDITRMVILGRVGKKFMTIYGIVKEAQDRAIRAVKAGAKIADVDNAGRSFIAQEGFGKYFGHALGHGVGLDVHEEPSISGHSKGTLQKGMVFTIEPAIYIPGFGGVRIEDMALVTDTGCDILTR